MTATFKYILATYLIIGLSLFACSNAEPSDENPPVVEGEMVFFNGMIYTVNDSAPWVEAIYVKDGVIEYVGSTEDAKNQATANAEMIDLDGAFMMPGIHDVHMHPLEACLLYTSPSPRDS